MFGECGVPEPGDAAVRLLQGVIANQAAAPGPGSITGPFPRGDTRTVAANLRALAGDPEAAGAYRAAGRVFVRLLEDEGVIGRKTARELWEVLVRKEAGDEG